MPEKITSWKKNMNIIKDISLLLSLIIITGGWIRSATIKETNIKNKIEILTNSINETTEQLKKINDILMEQQTLNGKIIQYLK